MSIDLLPTLAVPPVTPGSPTPHRHGGLGFDAWMDLHVPVPNAAERSADQHGVAEPVPVAEFDPAAGTHGRTTLPLAFEPAPPPQHVVPRSDVPVPIRSDVPVDPGIGRVAVDPRPAALPTFEPMQRPPEVPLQRDPGWLPAQMPHHPVEVRPPQHHVPVVQPPLPSVDAGPLLSIPKQPLPERDGVVVFELHLRGVDGSTEIVSLPWRLAGNARLSQYDGVSHAASAIQPAARPSSAAITAANLPDSAPLPGFAAPPGAGVGTTIPSPVSTSAYVASPRRFAAATEVREVAQQAVVAEPWAAQLLRWLEREGRDPTLWVRDYRLDRAGADAIFDQIRQLAEQQGRALERIVINAREAWRAGRQETV